MSVHAQPERLPEDGRAPAMAAPGIPAEAAPAPSAHPAVAHFRLQRMDDSTLRQLGRLTNTFAKIRHGALREKDVRK